MEAGDRLPPIPWKVTVKADDLWSTAVIKRTILWRGSISEFH